MSARTYYAIGDVHGEDLRLQMLHAAILADIEREGCEATIVHLGDYVDRGLESRGVIARVMALEAAYTAVSLKGNHEEMMLCAYDRSDRGSDSYWASNGGEATISSYFAANGRAEDWREAIDKAHIKWLRTLPTLWRDEERKIAFVHAGIDPQTFPECDEEIRIWTRSGKFFDPARWPARPELDGWLIVHGHTPTENNAPEVLAQRINVDTGAVYGGPLTCVVLTPGEAPRFLRA